MKPSKLLLFACLCLLSACSGANGPTPPPILAAYGDFEYAEHDTTWLQQLPVVTFKSEMLFTDGELSDAGLQGAAALYPQGGDKWIVYAYNTGAYFLEKNGSRWTATRIGAVGQGPGEYENNRLAGTMVTDSTLWLNISGIRHLKYTLDGQFLGEAAFRSTAAMASLEHLRLCRDGTMTRVQLLDPDGDHVGMLIKNAHAGILYASYFRDGITHYVKLK